MHGIKLGLENMNSWLGGDYGGIEIETHLRSLLERMNRRLNKLNSLLGVQRFVNSNGKLEQKD